MPSSLCSSCTGVPRQDSICGRRDRHSQAGYGDAGPSNLPLPAASAKKRRRREGLSTQQRGLWHLTASLLFLLGVSSTVSGQTSQTIQKRRRPVPTPVVQTAEQSLGSLLRKREKSRRAYGPNQNLNFHVDVTPPTTCRPMNITFDTQGGQAPFTIFVGFGQWFGYTIQLPASYADQDVTQWLYQFNVPVFRPFTAPSTPTPPTVVVVSDSTGNMMNSSSFQNVVEGDTSCASVTGDLHFTFYTDPTITTCTNMAVHWSAMPPLPGFNPPLDMFVLRERAPPIHIGIQNASAGVYSYHVNLQPGLNVMFSMTDVGGSGGVSGQNTVGGSEYIGQQCLAAASSSIDPIGVPCALSTLNNLRMPDYTAVLASTTTSNGVVKTATVVATYRNGSSIGGDAGIGKGSIAGLSVAVAVGAAILAAVLSWIWWRRRGGRRSLLWDVPKSMEGELSKQGGSGPTDQDFYRNRGRAMARGTSATAPMLPSLSSPSETSDPTQHSPPWSAESQYGRYNNLSSVLSPFNDPPSSVGGASITRRGSEGSSSIASNPFGNSHATPAASRSYRSLFSARRGGGGGGGGGGTIGSGTDAADLNALPLTDTHYSHFRHQTEPTAASMYEGAEPRYGHGTYNSSATSRVQHPTYLQHSDAGLLLDDSLEPEDGLMGPVELPPQYDAVPRRLRNQAGTSSGGMTAAAASSSSAATSATGLRPTADVTDELPGVRASFLGEKDEDADEREFWRSVD